VCSRVSDGNAGSVSGFGGGKGKKKEDPSRIPRGEVDQVSVAAHVGPPRSPRAAM
jgi:hypothetical protein